MIGKEAWVDIKTLHRQGHSIRVIARELGLSRKTVRRYLRSEDPPRYVPTKRRPSLLDPYKDYLQSRLAALPELPATVLLREIQAQGYQGKITLIKISCDP
jgi:transposase